MSKTLKDEVIELIRRLPDDATISDVIGELRARQKIETGLAELDAGAGLTHDQVKQRLSRWLN